MENIHNKLLDISNDLRKIMDDSRIKEYMLSLIFYQFLSIQIEKFANELEEGMSYFEIYEEEPDEVKAECLEVLGYFIEPSKLFSSFVVRYQDGENIIEDFSNTLTKVELEANTLEAQESFKGLLTNLNLTSQELGIDATAKNKTIGELLVKLSEIDFQFNNNNVDIFEYLILLFSLDIGKKATSYYTPKSITTLISEIIASNEMEVKTIYDPTCGTGQLLLNVANKVGIENVDLYGEELNASTYNLARMNMIIHKVKYDRFKIKNTNTLENPQLIDEKFDVAIAHPPFSMSWSADSRLLEDRRFQEFGKLAPKTKSEFAFVQHMLYQINNDGIAVIVLPHGPLYRGAAEKVIREHMLNNNQIDTIIGLPPNVYTETSIPTVIMVLKKVKNDDKVLFIDASHDFIKIKAQNILNDQHIGSIIKTYKERELVVKNENETEYSKLVSLDKIKENNYNLNIQYYVNNIVPQKKIDKKDVLEKIRKNRKKQLELEEKITKLK